MRHQPHFERDPSGADAREREEVGDGQDGADQSGIEEKDLRNIVVLRVLRDIMY